jgi:hypothetical protein
MEDKKIVRESVVYDIENMIVTRWGARWAYWRYDVKNVPDEVRLYCLKGFIDDLQDCTASIKKGDYKDTEDGRDAYRLDCQHKRRELEKHINEGTRPRTNASETSVDKKALAAAKSVAKVISLEGLIVKQVMYPATFTEQDAIDLARLMKAKVELEAKN